MKKLEYFCEIKPRYVKKKGFTQNKISDSKQLQELAKSLVPESEMNLREVLGIIFLDSENKTMGYNIVTTGTIDGTILDIKQVIQNALICNAVSIAIFHNHPSGNLEPSNKDLSATMKLKEACDILNINLLDSIIVTENNVLSILN